jgi:alkylated DNA repair dioxygenase AlkB
MQGELFQTVHRAADIAAIPGFSLTPDYVTEKEERTLLAHLDPGPWQSDWRRRIQQYGLGYGETGRPSWLRDFPAWLTDLAARVARDAQFERLPENCVINEYIPPQGIAPHKDYPAFGPSIACVSLGSQITLDFIKADRSVRIPVHVPARSLWVITGEARSQWLHGIAPRLNDVIDGMRQRRGRRISITFRTASNASSVPNRIHGPDLK